LKLLFEIEEKTMAKMKRGALAASTLLLVAIIASACNQPYSQAPVVTNTPIDQDSLFATPLGNSTQMTDVERFATGTAAALLTGTPVPGSITNTPAGVTPQTATQTSTPLVVINPTTTPTATLAVSGPTSTLLPAGSRPATWTLQKEEFPFCIARRFDVNPETLLKDSGLVSPDIYYAGDVMRISQNLNDRWPVESLGPRALRNHPGTYTVTGNADTTVYGVACKFGDVLPEQIAQTNGISVSATFSIGKTLNIP
jgi:hypothetical protein